MVDRLRSDNAKYVTKLVLFVLLSCAVSSLIFHYLVDSKDLIAFVFGEWLKPVYAILIALLFKDKFEPDLQANNKKYYYMKYGFILFIMFAFLLWYILFPQFEYRISDLILFDASRMPDYVPTLFDMLKVNLVMRSSVISYVFCVTVVLLKRVYKIHKAV